MSSPAAQEEQLLELLLQLKKTTPDQARAILNAQPQISYALMALMVNLNAINMEVTQRTLASFGAGGAPATAPPVPAPSVAPPQAPVHSAAVPPQAPHIPVQPMPAIPPHMNNQPGSRGNTPPYARGGTPTYPQSNVPPAYPSRGGTPSYPPPGPGYPMHQQQPAPSYPPQHMPPPHMRGPYGGPPVPPPMGGYGGPPPHGAPPPQAAPTLPEAFNNIPEEQKALIMRVLQMTPDQIAQLPPQERANIIQLRQTLGLPA